MTAVHDPDKSAREEIEARLRKAMGSAGFAADALIGHLRSLGAAAATADGPRPEPWFPATEGAMRAAVSHTFTPPDCTCVCTAYRPSASVFR